MVDILWTQTSGETLQPVISGNVDVGVAIGMGQAMAAFARGAPVRVIGGNFTGASDIIWYVPAKSPIRSLADTSGKSIAYGSTGASTHIAALAAVRQFKVDANLVPTGSHTVTMTQVLSGQVDVGWMAPPIGLQAEADGQIRIIGTADLLPDFSDQTVRIILANANALESRRDVIARFMQGYRDTLDWLYAGTAGVKVFAETMGHSEPIALRTRQDFFPKERMSPDRVGGIDGITADAIKFKVLAAPLSPEQLRTLVQIPPPIK